MNTKYFHHICRRGNFSKQEPFSRASDTGWRANIQPSHNSFPPLPPLHQGWSCAHRLRHTFCLQWILSLSSPSDRGYIGQNLVFISISPLAAAFSKSLAVCSKFPLFFYLPSECHTLPGACACRPLVCVEDLQAVAAAWVPCISTWLLASYGYCWAAG
jgi:hypothetical protein